MTARARALLGQLALSIARLATCLAMVGSTLYAAFDFVRDGQLPDWWIALVLGWCAATFVNEAHRG